MSMTVTVLVERTRIPTASRWQRAITELGLEVTLDPSWTIEHDGYLPCMLGDDEESGFELYIEDGIDNVPVPEGAIGQRDRAVSFVWHGDMAEACCAVAAAAALVYACDGIAVDDDGAILSVDDLRAEHDAMLNEL